jgi:hypothetical protein
MGFQGVEGYHKKGEIKLWLLLEPILLSAESYSRGNLGKLIKSYPLPFSSPFFHASLR